MLKEGTIELVVWGVGICDDEINITNSNGFSLEELQEIYECLQSIDWGEYKRKELIIKPYYIKSQIGNYPPPNIESYGYWDFDIKNVKGFAD